MKVGIVLSGGLAKGAYQFGFLKAILKYIPREDIKIVSGSSIGIINAYGLSANKMDYVENVWRTVHFENLWQLMGHTWFKHFIRKNTKALMRPEDNLDIPLYLTITYLPLFRVRYYLLEGKYSKVWPKFARAAVGFPFVTGMPKTFHFKPTVDGGAGDNIPIFPLMEKHSDELDMIFAIHFDSQYLLKKEWVDKDTLVVDIDASLNNNLRKHSFNFDTRILNKMVDAGYEYGLDYLEKLFGNSNFELEEVRKRFLEIYESEFEERMKYGTLDRLVTLLNGFSQLFRSKRCIKPLIKNKKIDAQENAVKTDILINDRIRGD